MGRGRAGAIATLAGFAVMCLELTAVRIMAPHFGDSAYVWTNVIGVMLVALAVGAWLGGRMADAARGPGRLASLFIAAGVLTALVPLLVGPLGGWLLPQDLPLDAAMAALVRGSLVATLLLFAPAITLVGCMTPMLVVALVGSGGAIGSSSGLIAATSTLGSLAGTFAATHVLVPELGSRATVWTCAGLILVCGILSRPHARAALWLLVPAGLLPWSHGPLRTPGPGEELLAEVESRYQFLQVVRTKDQNGATVALKINEGLDSFHSVALDGTAFTGGRYYDYHAAVPFLVGDGKRPETLRVLSLGAAAGTFGRLFAASHPGCSMDAVEIDPAVVALGEAHFGGRPESGRVFSGLDARVFVERADGPYEVVLVDCYERQIYVPAHVASREFFSGVERILAPGGVVSVNSGGRTFADPVLQAIAGTMAAVFGEAWAFRVPDSRNFVVIARKGRAIDPSVLEPEVGNTEELRQVLEETARPHAWRRIEPGTLVLDDDRPALDSLQETALGRSLGSGDLVAMRGNTAPDEVAEQMTSLTENRDPEGALLAAKHASEPTVRTRVLTGDARWHLHDLEGAMLEYGDAFRLATGADSNWRDWVRDERLEPLGQELARRETAWVVARRNGWLAAGAALLLLLLGTAAATRVSRA